MYGLTSGAPGRPQLSLEQSLPSDDHLEEAIQRQKNVTAKPSHKWLMRHDRNGSAARQFAAQRQRPAITRATVRLVIGLLLRTRSGRRGNGVKLRNRFFLFTYELSQRNSGALIRHGMP